MTGPAVETAPPAAAPANDENSAPADENLTVAPVSPVPPAAAKKKPVWSPDANHGRYGFDDYYGLETVTIRHQSLHAGDACPVCAEAGQSGKVGPHDAGYLIRLVGQPLVTGKRYRLAGYRCSLCSSVYKPDVPAEIKETPKYAPSAVSNIAVGHYTLGLPFNRIEFWQQNSGVPLADSTQYDEMAKLTKKCLPVFICLEKLSADSTVLHYDDTSQKVLELGKGRGTAVVGLCGAHTIYLFYTSGRSGGKEASRLLERRTSEDPLITMTDAGKCNELSEADGVLFTRLIIAFCLVHGRRKFYDLLDLHPSECSFVVDCIAEVYRNEAHCKKEKLIPLQRLLYHRRHSGPVMDALKIYLTNLWLYGGAEHNGALGQAIQYMLKRWAAMTRFLEVEGCPLDNSICERAVKVMIRYRKNSLFYRTIKGAMCGDVLMSLIHTAVRNGVNAADYLNALQAHEKAAAAAPENFLPWNYRATLAALAQDEAA